MGERKDRHPGFLHLFNIGEEVYTTVSSFFNDRRRYYNGFFPLLEERVRVR
jgi:hypothetical protein